MANRESLINYCLKYFFLCFDVCVMLENGALGGREPILSIVIICGWQDHYRSCSTFACLFSLHHCPSNGPWHPNWIFSSSGDFRWLQSPCLPFNLPTLRFLMALLVCSRSSLFIGHASYLDTGLNYTLTIVNLFLQSFPTWIIKSFLSIYVKSQNI